MREIIISNLAQNQIDDVLEFLLSKWSLKTKNQFIEKLDAVLGIIQKNPELYPISKTKPKYHKCVVTKHNTLIYKFDSQHVFILSLFDTRQHPDRLKLND